VSRILFVMLHPGFIRYYEDAVYALADAGHHVHLAFETTREKMNESALATRVAARSERITHGTTPPRAESVRDFIARADRTATRGGEFTRRATRRERRAEAWESLATMVRLQGDYLRFFEPAFTRAHKLRERAEKRLPHTAAAVVRTAARGGAGARRVAAATLGTIERAIPTPEAIEAFIREQTPDLLLVTPLIELGSQQVDYVKCARRLGVRSALCVASWDNLTSKGLVRVIPDHVLVWNEAQKREAVSLHGVPAERIRITGAQLFDGWFAAQPSRSRDAFCGMVGLDPARPFVLYVGSSVFIAPDEVPFAERWLGRLRRDPDPVVASAGVLIRPHPANSRQWRAFDASAFGNVGVWPPIGSDPNSPDGRRDYFDSLYHSAAVVGINTSAQIEAGIVGRPVFTVQAAEFEHAQAGTLHFHHLVNAEGGVVQTASSLDEHAAQLRSALDGSADAGEATRQFIRSFIRPYGEHQPATPTFVGAIAELAALPPPLPRRDPSWVRVARVPTIALAYGARTISEDRPLWVYATRPFVTAAVWTWALGYRAAAAARSVGRAAKPLRRRTHQLVHESSQRVARRRRRANKALARAVRSAGSAARRVLKRA
jgi:hypothetical protein